MSDPLTSADISKMEPQEPPPSRTVPPSGPYPATALLAAQKIKKNMHENRLRPALAKLLCFVLRENMIITGLH
jgi:hypothetical protein